MEHLQAYTAQEIEATGRQFTPGLFTQFVQWIDRGERTTRTYIINLRQFGAWMLYAAVTNPRRDDVLFYRHWLGSEHDAIQLDQDAPAGWSYRIDKRTGQPLRITCKPATITAYLRIVCQFFRWTAANNLYPDIAANIHAPAIDHTVHKKDALSPEDVRAIEISITQGAADRQQEAAQAAKDTAGRMQRSAEQGKRLYAMYLLAVTAGLRTIELHRANVRDLDTRGGQTWLYVWGKGHAEPDRKVPIAPEVAAAIQDYIQTRTDRPTKDSPLFASTGNRSGGKRIATTTISTMIKRALQAAGYDSERITAHTLRHTAGTAALEVTGDLYATQKYMRHADPKTTEIYLHNQTEKQEAGIAKNVYKYYHETGTADKKEALASALDRMTPEQIERLTVIAQAMA